jgi:hypothetical protein
MSAKLYDYLNERRENVISAWLMGLPIKQLAKVIMKLETLRIYGDETLPSFVTPAVGSGSIKEIVIGGDRALRLLLCRGPIEVTKKPRGKKTGNGGPSAWASPEFTLLMGAEERDSKYVPRNAVQQAESHREIVLRDPTRREEHVYIGPENT